MAMAKPTEDQAHNHRKRDMIIGGSTLEPKVPHQELQLLTQAPTEVEGHQVLSLLSIMTTVSMNRVERVRVTNKTLLRRRTKDKINPFN